MGSLLGNIRLTFAIAAMAVCSIAIAIGAVLLGLFISLSNTARIDAEGIDLANGDDTRRIWFEKTLSVPQDMHLTLVQMARTARAGLMEI